MRILGVTASGFLSPATGSYDLIETALVTSNTSSIVFDTSTFSDTYKHLQIRWVARADRPGADNCAMVMRLNGDSETNYSTHNLGAIDSSFNSDWNGPSSSLIGFFYTVATNFSPTGVFSSGVIDILDPYSTSKNTTVRCLSGNLSSNRKFISLAGGNWRNTAAITSINIFENGGLPYMAGSRFSLYGIKG